MKTSEGTLLLAAPQWTDPRVHLLDDIWLLAIFAILLAIGVPWAASGLRVDLTGVALGLAALAAIHVAFTALINPARTADGTRAPLLAALHVVGVIVVGIIWHYAGGLQNAAFLLVFALPVVGAIFLSRRQPYLIATTAVLTICVVALIEAPELRWYAGFNSAWIAAIFGQGNVSLTPAFPELYAPSGYFVVLLEVFAIILFGCAVAAEYLGTVFDRLHAQVFAARIETERAQELWTALLSQLPLPTLLLDAETLKVVCESRSVAADFCDDQQPAVGRELFEAIRFSYPDAVQELIEGTGGLLRLSVIHVGGELRITDVRIQHMVQRGRRFAVVVIEDKTEAFCVKAALDVADNAALVLDAEGRVLALNKPVQVLFARVAVGANAARLLAHPNGARNWWDPALAGRLKMQARIEQRLYQVTSTALTLPGEEERIFVVAFRPAVREIAADRTGTTATMVQLS